MRPPEVDERVIPGHWEADLIKGSANKSAVGMLSERIRWLKAFCTHTCAQ